MAGIELLELNEWLARQLAAWDDWARARPDELWLALPTGNERFASVGELYRHCFSPLLRYSAQAAENPPPDDSHIDAQSWTALHGWAVAALANHRAVCSSVTPQNADAVLAFTTRSAGVLSVARRMALAHAATHCFWHLGGIAHLLRLSGIAPPQRSDLLFYAIAQTAQPA